MCVFESPVTGWPDTGDAGLCCCYGAAIYGPDRCGCWLPVYDVVQQRPRLDLPSSVMPKMCGDCAFRPNSPERQGHPSVRGDWETLQALVVGGEPFWCHDGLRAPVAFVHPPSGTWHVVDDDLAFHPPIQRDAHGIPTPYRANGSPGDLCAGWTAMRLHHERQEVSS